MNILKENSTIIIIIIYGYILFKYIEENDYVTMGIVTFIAALIAYKLRKNVEGFTPREQLQEKSIPELQELLRTFPSSQEEGFVMPDNQDTLITMIRESELEAKTDEELRNIAQDNGISSQEVDTLISENKSTLITMIIQAVETDQVTAPETDITSSTDTELPSQQDQEVQQEESEQGGTLDSNRVLPGESQEYRKLREEARSSNDPISDDAPSAAGATTLGVSDGKDVESVSTTATTGDENFEEGSEVTLKSADNNLFRMGPYDGLCISKGPDKNYELASEEEIRTYFGVQAPMNMEVGQPNNEDLSGPTVDGDDDSPQRLSMLSNNKSKFDCCTNSPFTTNSGCICLTEKQRHFINTRGFNKSQPDI